MDMSTKEISAITGQSISSLEVERTRLRKKLGISNTQIGLSQFLSNY
jgi:DNA-binding CsgD family transcriptional regulator